MMQNSPIRYTWDTREFRVLQYVEKTKRADRQSRASLIFDTLSECEKFYILYFIFLVVKMASGASQVMDNEAWKKLVWERAWSIED